MPVATYTPVGRVGEGLFGTAILNLMVVVELGVADEVLMMVSATVLVGFCQQRLSVSDEPTLHAEVLFLNDKSTSPVVDARTVYPNSAEPPDGLSTHSKSGEEVAAGV